MPTGRLHEKAEVMGKQGVGKWAWGGLLLIMTMSSCAKPEHELDCGPMDQRESYLPPLPTTGTQIQLAGSTSPDVLRAVVHAAAVWNEEVRPLVGTSLYTVVQSASSGRMAPAPVDRECDGVDGSSAWFQLREEWSQAGQPGSTWTSLGLDASNPAVTLRCYQGGTLSRQVVLVNPRYAVPAQLTSIVLHELGHALGLEHSCQLEGSTSKWLGCQGLEAGHAYRIAVMFPFLTVGANPMNSFEVKEALQLNDRQRLQCRYSR